MGGFPHCRERAWALVGSLLAAGPAFAEAWCDVDFDELPADAGGFDPIDAGFDLTIVLDRSCSMKGKPWKEAIDQSRKVVTEFSDGGHLRSVRVVPVPAFPSGQTPDQRAWPYAPDAATRVAYVPGEPQALDAFDEAKFQPQTTKASKSPTLDDGTPLALGVLAALDGGGFIAIVTDGEDDPFNDGAKLTLADRCLADGGTKYCQDNLIVARNNLCRQASAALEANPRAVLLVVGKQGNVGSSPCLGLKKDKLSDAVQVAKDLVTKETVRVAFQRTLWQIIAGTAGALSGPTDCPYVEGFVGYQDCVGREKGLKDAKGMPSPPGLAAWHSSTVRLAEGAFQSALAALKASAARVRPPPTVLGVEHQGRQECSGVLVSPRVALTARHCPRADEVVALTARATDQGLRTRVSAIEAHPDPRVDVVALILERPLALELTQRRRGADRQPPLGPLRLMGYGAQDRAGRAQYKTLRSVIVPATGSWGCGGYRTRWSGCYEGRELVLADTGGLDACKGDSGGPVFECVRVGHHSEWRLVALTSRSVPDATVPCGEGGIYARVDILDEWLTRLITRHEAP